MIRQITIDCAERGFLLVRVRDEQRMTVQAYQTLYESSIAYGMRKALTAEQKKIEMTSKIKDLEDNCEDLMQEMNRLANEQASVIREFAQEMDKEDRAHRATVDHMSALNADYTQELTTLLTAPPQKEEDKKR